MGYKTRQLLVCLFCLFGISGYAQLDVQLNINPNISPYLYEWEGAGAQDILVTVQNPQTSQVQAIFRVWVLNGAGEEIGNSSPGDSPVVPIEPGMFTAPLAELFPISALNYEGDYETEIVQTGKLPEDNYTMCIEALQPSTLQPLSQTSCASFNVMGYQDPFNIFPPDGQEVELSVVQDMVFQWSSVVPVPNFGGIYQFSIYEVFPGQDPVEALNVNPSIVSEEIFDETQFLMPLDYAPFEPNEGGYVWNVRAVNPGGETYTEPNGQSEPSVFYVSDGTQGECTCVSCTLTGMSMFVNGQESASLQVPSNSAVSFVPQYDVVCDPDDCPVVFDGYLTATYSSQQNPDQTFQLQAGEEIVLPGSGLLYITWSGSATCDGSICTCEGTYGPVQWQVTSDEVTDPTGGTSIKDGEETGGTGEDMCECGPCSLQSLSILQDGQPLDGENLPIGTPLTINAEISASCVPESCEPLVNGYFKVGYTPQGGSWTEHVLADESSTFSIPKGVSMLIVDFVGTVYCDGQPCPCDGVNGLEIFVNPYPVTGGPPDPIPDPENPGEPPPEKVPPDSIEMACNPLIKRLDPATPIDLGMVLEEPETFPFPRAVPIHAEGIDWDYAIFECDGCEGGKSRIQYPVKDRMNWGAYRWRIISGLGSLNDPFSADSIQKAEENKQAILDEIDKLNKKRDELNDRLARGIAADTARYSQMLNEVKTAYESLKEEHEAIKDSIADLSEAEQEEYEYFQDQQDTLGIFQDSVSAIQIRIQDLEEKLSNPPSAEEEALLIVAEEKAEEWQAARDDVAAFEETILEERQAIEDNLKSLKEAERSSADAYVDASNDILAQTRAITELEESLYNTPELRAYRKARIKWNIQYNSMFGSFVSGYAPENLWEIKKESIRDKTLELALTHPDDREDEYQVIHTELMSFVPLPGQACVVHSENETCGLFASELVSATFDYDTAMSNLNNSASFLDPATRAALAEARAQLESSESALVTLRSNAAQASIAYNAAAEESIQLLRDLEEQKIQKIATMDQKAEEAGAAEANYQTAKGERQANFEANKLGWELALAEERNRESVFHSNISAQVDSIVSIQARLDLMRTELRKLVFEEEALQDQLDKLENSISNLERILEALKEEPEKIEEELEELANRLKDLEEELKKAEEHLAKVSQPKRFASGPEVYYIPPPLEEVFKVNGKMPTFQEYISKVDSAKAELQIAQNNKRSIQNYLVSVTDQVAWELLGYKNNENRIAELEERISELDQEIAQAQGELALEEMDDHADLQQKYDEAKAKQKEAEDKAEECEESDSEQKQKVEDLIERRDQAKQELDEKKEELATARSQKQYQEDLFRNSSNTLRERSGKVQEMRSEIVALEQELGRLQNEKTIAKAQDEEGLGDDVTGEDALESELESAETELAGLESSLASIESSQQSNALALKNATKSVFEADSLMVIARDEYLALEDSLEAAYEELKEGANCSNHWATVAKEWERKAEKIKKAIDSQTQATSDKIQEDEGVSELNKQKEEAEAQLKEIQEALAKNESSVSDILSEKAQRIEKADAELKAAKEKLEEAEKALRDWLVKEFESVTFDVEIELIGDDEIVDKWRSNDGEVKLIRKLRYSGSRIPKLQNKYAKGSIPELTTNAICQVTLDKLIGGMPDKLIPPTPLGPEPRTIALVYENGKPIWPEWPVIPQDEKRFLQKDVLLLASFFTPDFDELQYYCSSNMDCPAHPPTIDGIMDVGSYSWNLEGRQINKSTNWRYAIWETAEVNKPLKEKKQELKSYFDGNLIVGDNPVEQISKYNVVPGVLIEVPDTLFGVPDTTVELLGRVVRGDHKGLPAEEVEFEARLIAGSSTGYGFDGDSLKTDDTDNLGYAKLDFDFGDGFAKFEVDVRWKRGGQVIESDKIILIAPVSIDIHKVGPGPPELAWITAAQAVDKGSADVKGLASGLPDCVYDGETELTEDCQRQMRCVAGLLDYYYGFVNEKVVEFEIDDSEISLKPPSDSTEYFGIAHTILMNVREDVEAEITASVEEKYMPLGRPGTAKATMSSELIEEFYIGEKDALFLVLLDNPVPIGTVINGQGMLGVDAGGVGIGLMIPLQQVKLEIAAVEVQKEGDGFIAIAGEVSWNGSVKAQVLSFDLEATKLGIEVDVGAKIEGTVGHEKSLPDPIAFQGIFSPSGDFVAGISNLPELEFKGLKLVQGASIVLDMHSNAGPTASLAFKGVFIPSASLELPSQFNKAETDEPTLLTAEDFYIGMEGVGGTISLSGTLFAVGFNGYVLSGKSVSITLENNELMAFEVGGQLDLGSPFQGGLVTTITHSGEEFKAEIHTETPIFIPQLKVVFSILPNSGFTATADVYTLELNANVQSEKIGTFKVDKLAIKSNGDVSVDEVGLEDGTLDFGSGFQIQQPKLSFTIANKESSFWLAGKVILPKLEDTYVDGKVGMKPGPVFFVEVNEAAITIEYGPVTMEGKLAFSQSEFRGEFGVGFKNMSAGIDGLLIFGNKPTEEGTTAFSYWYAELSVPVAIPLGSTGVSILKLGGGLGFNYTPPMGDVDGFAVHTNALSFKALMGFGNTPQGKVLAGEVQVSFTVTEFSLYGRVWALNKRESFFGEGQMTLVYDPTPAVLKGYIGMGVKLPDPEGSLMDFDGKVSFLCNNEGLTIKSDELAGSVLQEIKAEGKIDIDPTKMHVSGKLWYDLNKSIDITEQERIEVVLNVSAQGNLDLYYATQTMSAGIAFNGNWRVTFVNRIYDLNITSGQIALAANAYASPTELKLEASAEISWDFWIASGSVNAKFGYSTPV